MSLDPTSATTGAGARLRRLHYAWVVVAITFLVSVLQRLGCVPHPAC